MLDEFLEYPNTEDGLIPMNELKHAQDHFRAILDIIYNKQPLKNIHWHLNEVASVLDLEDELKELDLGEQS